MAALYEDALVYESGSAITSSGALSAYSGAKTGRSPSDKRIVEEDSSKKDVWWGPVNKPMTPDVSISLTQSRCFTSQTNRLFACESSGRRHGWFMVGGAVAEHTSAASVNGRPLLAACMVAWLPRIAVSCMHYSFCRIEKIAT